MMNAKKSPTKISNVQRNMNKMLYSVSFNETSNTKIGFRIPITFNFSLCCTFNEMDEKELR
jgi:hypothetical protein